jgi:uncharacterized protein YgbK (DUF1537 family)
MPPLIGCIADDMTGATDLANALARGGMRTVQLIGVPEAPSAPQADALVVALKSRTAPVDQAVAQSRAALDWLRRAGVRQVLFKYCSTFDSTPEGNIGPIIDALLEGMAQRFTIACPAFPETGRTVYQGHLFVGRQLLSESAMSRHPLTPMTDSDLVRWLGRQTRVPVGHVPLAIIREGPVAIREAFDRLRGEGMGCAIVDAVLEEDLRILGEACADLPLITGASGLALGLPENFRRAGLIKLGGSATAMPEIAGTAAVLAGSCSPATLGQIQTFAASRPALALDPLALAEGQPIVEDALRWAEQRLGREPVLIYASAPPDRVAAVQERLGRERAGALIEQALAGVASGLVERGVRRLVVAGGETAGAVVTALGLKILAIGPQIESGVPWTVSLGEPSIALALKSGNFGGPDFFAKAFEMLP